MILLRGHNVPHHEGGDRIITLVVVGFLDGIYE
jgi:hypothetical protein